MSFHYNIHLVRKKKAIAEAEAQEAARRKRSKAKKSDAFYQSLYGRTSDEMAVRARDRARTLRDERRRRDEEELQATLGSTAHASSSLIPKLATSTAAQAYTESMGGTLIYDPPTNRGKGRVAKLSKTLDTAARLEYNAMMRYKRMQLVETGKIPVNDTPSTVPATVGPMAKRLSRPDSAPILGKGKAGKTSTLTSSFSSRSISRASSRPSSAKELKIKAPGDDDSAGAPPSKLMSTCVSTLSLGATVDRSVVPKVRVNPYVGVKDHKFRERYADKELGMPFMEFRTRNIPHVAYNPGGELNSEATETLKRRTWGIDKPLWYTKASAIKDWAGGPYHDPPTDAQCKFRGGLGFKIPEHGPTFDVSKRWKAWSTPVVVPKPRAVSPEREAKRLQKLRESNLKHRKSGSRKPAIPVQRKRRSAAKEPTI